MILALLTTAASFSIFIFIDDLITPAISMSRISVLTGFLLWLSASAIIAVTALTVVFHTTIVHLILLPLVLYPAYMQVIIFFGKKLTK